MALFPFNSQELLQVGSTGFTAATQHVLADHLQGLRRVPNNSNRCWCSSCQILFCLSTLGSHKWDSSGDLKGRRVVVARRRRTVTRNAASTPYVTACVNWAGHIVLEPTVPATVPTPISVLRDLSDHLFPISRSSPLTSPPLQPVDV